MLVMQRELGPGAPFWRVLVVDYRKLVRSDDVETSTVFIAVGQPQNPRCCIHCNTEGYAVGLESIAMVNAYGVVFDSRYGILLTAECTCR